MHIPGAARIGWSGVIEMKMLCFSRRKLLPTAVIVLVIAVGAVLLLSRGRGKGAERVYPGGNEGRVAYLEKLGWQVEPEPLETLQIKLPADLKGYEDYLALQTEQGLPFADCGGKVVCRYTYRVTNYPGGRRDAQVNLLQCDGAVVAGDVVLLGEDGGVFGLKFPK